MDSNGDKDTHMGCNHIVAITNYYHIQQERYQSLQDYRDQYVAYRKVRERLGIKVITSESGGTNMLKRMKIANPFAHAKQCSRCCTQTSGSIQTSWGA